MISDRYEVSLNFVEVYLPSDLEYSELRLQTQVDENILELIYSTNPFGQMVVSGLNSTTIFEFSLFADETFIGSAIVTMATLNPDGLIGENDPWISIEASSSEFDSFSSMTSPYAKAKGASTGPQSPKKALARIHIEITVNPTTKRTTDPSSPSQLVNCPHCQYLGNHSISQHNQICYLLEANENDLAESPNAEYLVIKTNADPDNPNIPSEVTVRLPDADIDEAEAEHLILAVFSQNQKMKVLQLVQQEAKMLIQGHRSSQNQLKELQSSIEETSEQMKVLLSKQSQVQDKLNEGTQARIREVQELETANAEKQTNIRELSAAIADITDKIGKVKENMEAFDSVKLKLTAGRQALNDEIKLRKSLHEEFNQSRSAFKTKFSDLMTTYHQQQDEKQEVYARLLSTRAEINEARQQFDTLRKHNERLSGELQKVLGRVDLATDELKFLQKKLKLAKDFQTLCDSLKSITIEAEKRFESQIRSVEELNVEIVQSSDEVEFAIKGVQNDLVVREDMFGALMHIRDGLEQRNAQLEAALKLPVPEAPEEDGSIKKDQLVKELVEAADTMINQVRRQMTVHKAEMSLIDLIEAKRAEAERLKRLISEEALRHSTYDAVLSDNIDEALALFLKNHKLPLAFVRQEHGLYLYGVDYLQVLLHEGGLTISTNDRSFPIQDLAV